MKTGCKFTLLCTLIWLMSSFVLLQIMQERRYFSVPPNQEGQQGAGGGFAGWPSALRDVALTWSEGEGGDGVCACMRGGLLACGRTCLVGKGWQGMRGGSQGGWRGRVFAPASPVVPNC